MQNGNRLDDYLAAIERRLKPLSPMERDEELRETRLHLEALRDKLAQEGAPDPDSATIRQFGTVDVVAGKILTAWRRGQRGAFRAAFFYSMGLWAFCALQIRTVIPLLTLLCNPPSSLWEGRTEIRYSPQQVFVPSEVTVSLLLLYLLGASVLSGRIFRGTIAARGAVWGFVAALTFETPGSYHRLSSFNTFLASDALQLRLFLALLTIVLGGISGRLLRPLSLRSFGFSSVLVQYLGAISAVGAVSSLAYMVAMAVNAHFPNGQILGIPWVAITLVSPHVAANIIAGIVVGRRAKQNPAKLVLAASAIAGLNFVAMWFVIAGQDLRFWDSNASFVLTSLERLGYNVGGALVLALVTAVTSALAYRQAHNRRFLSR